MRLLASGYWLLAYGKEVGSQQPAASGQQPAAKMNANRMTHPEKLRKGQRIKIPIQQTITASVGDTREGLAEEHMGQALKGRRNQAVRLRPCIGTVSAAS